MASWQLRVFLRMQMRLEAEESWEYVRMTQAATGHMDDTSFRSYMNELQIKINALRPVKRKPPMSEDDFRQLAGAIPGFKIEIQDSGLLTANG